MAAQASSPETCDVAIIGGGFAALATLANIVQHREKPLSVCIIARGGLGDFGPAYSTPRHEHLLNVRAGGMSLWLDQPTHFAEWCRQENIAGASPAAFMPRAVYHRYLQHVLDGTLAQAKEKGIAVHMLDDTSVAVAPGYSLSLQSGKAVAASHIVLATGNNLRAARETAIPGVVTDPWHYDYAALPGSGTVAVIGSGLTAMDAIISLLNAKWPGKIICLSSHALLPRAHLASVDAARTPKLKAEDFVGKPLSALLHNLRSAAKPFGTEWPYAVDALRSLTQLIWQNMAPFDRQRLAGKYFSLWNVHRHRAAPQIWQQVDAAIQRGQLQLVKARAAGYAAEDSGVKISLRHGDTLHVDRAFICTGIGYGAEKDPLFRSMREAGLLPAGNVAADGSFRIGGTGSNGIYALGAPLFQQLFETTAVPELRLQADKIGRVLAAKD